MPTYFINQNAGYPKRPRVQTGEQHLFIKDNTAALELSTGGVSPLFCDFYCTGEITKRKALTLFYKLKAKALAQIDTAPPTALGQTVTVQETINGKD